MQFSEPPTKPAAKASEKGESPEFGPRWSQRTGVLFAVAVLALTAVGFAIRFAVAQESMYGDEVATYWILSSNGLGEVLSTVHSDAEITPPLFFILAWLTTQIDLTPELARAPSLVTGTLCMPLVYLLGLRTVGRPAALLATAFIALSPFLIYYSAEARGYALMMALVVMSTLAMLLAVDTHRGYWWVVYAACSCGAVYTHYTSVFALGPQLLWLLWAHPEARRPALFANLAAAVGFAPWLSGVRADFGSWTTVILDELNALTWEHVWVSVSHATVGYAYRTTSVTELPGWLALALFALALVLAVGGLGVRVFRTRSRAGFPGPDRRLLLVIAVAVAVPVGEAVASMLGTNVFGGRNLISGLPAFALCLAALLLAAGPRLRFVTVALALACLSVGAVGMLDEQRPRYRAAAEIIDREASPDDVVIDAAVLSPGPYSPMDVALQRPHLVIRALAPDQRERPFGLFERRVPGREAAAKAMAAAGGGRIFLVSVPSSHQPGLRGTASTPSFFRPRYRRIERHRFPGTEDLVLDVWSDEGSLRESRR